MFLMILKGIVTTRNLSGGPNKIQNSSLLETDMIKEGEVLIRILLHHG